MTVETAISLYSYTASGIGLAISISMDTLIVIPRGIYTKCTLTGTHSISYPSIRGFSLSADSLEALMGLVDMFWCPSNRAGITSTSQLHIAMTNSLEDTCPIIHIENIPKAS